MTPPTRYRCPDAYDERCLVGLYPDNYHLTNVFGMSNVIGGVMTPPYGAINSNFIDQLSKTDM